MPRPAPRTTTDQLMWYGRERLTSRDDQLGQTEGSTLQNGTRDSDKGSHEDSVSSSEFVTKVHGTQASKGSAKIEGGNGRSLDQGVVGLHRPMSGGYIDLGKLGVDRVIAGDAAKE